MPAFSLRPASKNDTATILELIRGIAAYEKLTHQLEATEQRLETAFFGPNPVARCLLAEAPGAGVVGYAVYVYNFSTFLAKPGLYLEDLYVTPEYRGKGIGKALFRACAEIAHREGCGRMEWVALDWNQPALDFYQSHGAERLDQWRLHRFDQAALQRLAQADDG